MTLEDAIESAVKLKEVEIKLTTDDTFIAGAIRDENIVAFRDILYYDGNKIEPRPMYNYALIDKGSKKLMAHISFIVEGQSYDNQLDWEPFLYETK